MPQQPKTRETVEALIQRNWLELGGDPGQIAIEPDEFGWSKSSSYKVKRKGQGVCVRRPLVDDIGRDHEIKAILEQLF